MSTSDVDPQDQAVTADCYRPELVEVDVDAAEHPVPGFATDCEHPLANTTASLDCPSDA